MRPGRRLLAGACLLTACAGSKDTTQGGGAAKASVSPGAQSYQRVCANCHLETGLGMVPAYRSLVGSPWATGSVDRAVAIVLFGVQGPVRDVDVTYYTAMLPYGSGARMSDDEVAAAITHVRTSWGNHASVVTAADVARVRARFPARTTGFTQAELDGWTDQP
ncbi:MAG: cytochrome c [Gemmatimonadaceae bacterium]|nr:cytochrome c [Gemmatimonadaceae bacterium]